MNLIEQFYFNRIIISVIRITTLRTIRASEITKVVVSKVGS